jgi:hypothetical protein
MFAARLFNLSSSLVVLLVNIGLFSFFLFDYFAPAAATI